jgi:hypothetical protein
MPSSGIHRLQTAKLTLEKKKGKELVKGIGQAFAPKEVLRVNNNIKKEAPKGKKNYK